MKALVLGLAFSLIATSFVFAMPALVHTLAGKNVRERTVLPRAGYSDPRPLVTPALPPSASPDEAAGLPRVPPPRAGHSEAQANGRARGSERGQKGRDRAAQAKASKGQQREQKKPEPPAKAGPPPTAAKVPPGKALGKANGGAKKNEGPGKGTLDAQSSGPSSSSGSSNDEPAKAGKSKKDRTAPRSAGGSNERGSGKTRPHKRRA